MNLKMMLDKWAIPPVRAHEADAGLDLRAPEEITIPHAIYGEWVEHDPKRAANGLPLKRESFASAGEAIIDTGVHIAIPQGYYGKIESKSGLNVKHSIVSLGGTIDAGYTGSIVVKLYNLSAYDYTFHAGDKIAQLIIQPCELPEFEWVESLDETERGDNGFGSSGR